MKENVIVLTQHNTGDITMKINDREVFHTICKRELTPEELMEYTHFIGVMLRSAKSDFYDEISSHK